MKKRGNKHLFSQVPHVNIPRSSFDRSYDFHTTLDGGYIVPFYADDVLPGDTFRARLHALIRMTTPIVPVMSNIWADFFFFFVPQRLVWEHSEQFFGQQEDPGDSIDYVYPESACPASKKVNNIEVGGTKAQDLQDYFGVPLHVPGLKFNNLDCRAYNLIYNQWFRDENLQDSLPVPKGDGPDNYTDFVLKKRNKRHDYFTSCLPWPQKGPGVDIPLGLTAPVISNGQSPVFVNTPGSTTGSSLYWRVEEGGSAPARLSLANTSVFDSNTNLYFSANPERTGLIADLTEAAAASINTLRQAFALQSLQEAWARGGSRYTEIVRSLFGVVSPDARLQRAEFLGGGSIRIKVNPVVQQSSSDATSPQGNLAAFAYGISNLNDGIGFSKSFTEHGFVYGFISIRTDLAYQQGLPRRLSRRTLYDTYIPQLANIGEQAVLMKELYATGTDADNIAFGYQERNAEYRYYPSQITGKMRSTSKNVTTGASDSLDIWHLAQVFDSAPTLGSDFIEENPPFKRLLAVQDEPEFWMDGYVELQCARPMPLYGVPAGLFRM
ncbi:MAG: phage capsid protein [Alphaproteobacteria bacterium]|nr:phage capsid protein [Alphaproteobacteria bacterium]